jgi:CRISPR-associated protein (TIGR03986 family)
MKSGTVKDARRAGRAPYNFVPLPERVRWVKEDDGPANQIPGDRYHTGCFSGEMEIELEALSDFYIRGMWPLGQFLSQGKSVKDQPLPFQAAGKLRLPGSSLRGMIRTLVEIMADCALHPINDRLMFFRAVGASPNPGDRSFEPNAKTYKDRVSPGSGIPTDPAYPIVRVGYLWEEAGQWKIRPAKKGPYGTQWYRVFAAPIPAKPAEIDFEPARPEIDHYRHSRNVYYRFGIVQHHRKTNAGAPPPAGWERGFLIQSGKIPRKYLQWIVHEPDSAAPVIDIPENDVDAYRLDGAAAKNIDYLIKPAEPKPCFYIHWKDNEKKDHVTFGDTPHFRLPYRTTPNMVNPARRKKGEKRWDLAEMIFGRTPDKDAEQKQQNARQRQAARGRVFFEDGTLQSAPPEPVGNEIHLVLGEPKPTTYQHYLVQENTEKPEDILHWDGDYLGRIDLKPVLRGFKRYWHRKPATLPSKSAPTNVTTTIRPGKQGCVFNAIVRFENLKAHELGALLTAIELPPNCAHKLGMGKAIGLGSFRVRLKQVLLCNRQKRYEDLFNADGTRWNTGLIRPANLKPAQDAFASWVIGRQSTLAALWTRERITELEAILRYERLEEAVWVNATRYLEIERVINGERRNEYKFPEKVRALPPASQVRKMGPEIPKD